MSKLYPNLIGGQNVQTDYIYPPIPLRQFDWCALFEGTEERGNYGYGETEEKAIADLRQKWRDGEYE